MGFSADFLFPIINQYSSSSLALFAHLRDIKESHSLSVNDPSLDRKVDISELGLIPALVA